MRGLGSHNVDFRLRQSDFSADGKQAVTLDFDRVHLTALQDPDPATRILAIRGLWEQEREDVMRLLVTTLRADTEASIKEAIGYAFEFVQARAAMRARR